MYYYQAEIFVGENVCEFPQSANFFSVIFVQ